MNKSQMKVFRNTLICTLFTLSLVAGCAEHVSERSGTQLDVVPVTYSIAVKIKPGEQVKASEKLAAFTDKYWQIIVNQGATISWQTNAGKILAEQYYKQLATSGVNTSDLNLTEMKYVQKNSTEQQNVGPKYDDDKYYDIEVKTTVHKIIVGVCQHPKVGHYDALSDGCYSESNRWNSMVHPEKMLDHTPKNML